MASVAFAVWAIIADEKHEPPDTATLLGVPIGVIGLVIAVVALRKSAEDNGVELARSRAGKLARQVRESESRVRSQLLGADTRRINLTYVLHSATARVATAPPAGRTFDDGPATLPDVLEYYRSTQPRRLVVTGAPGAGKTVLALELMLALIKHRGEGDPVPVRIPLAQWDTTQPLTTLLVQRLVEAYKWPTGMAAGLVAHGMVLPVLDGLDEMDPLRTDGTPDPEAPRARAALEALNAYQDGLEAGPLVLTCRTGHYDAFAPVSRLIDAARIAIAPIDTRHAVAYLRDRARDAPRWQPLIDHLDTQPAGPLATTLSTPWRLCLTATVYHRDGNPSELLHHPDGHDLDQHLLARYLPSAVANTPNPHHYQPDDVHRWLHHLTGHLTGTTTNAPATDITLHHLWTLAGTTRVRIADLLLTTLTLAPACYLATVFASDSAYAFSFALAETGFVWFFASPVLGNYKFPVILFVAFTAFTGIIAFRPTLRPNRFRITRGTLQGGFTARFWAGFKTWFTVGFTIAITDVITNSIGIPDSIGIADAITDAITDAAVMALSIETGLIGGFMGGLAGGFADGFKAWFRGWFTVGLVVNLGLGVWLGVWFGLWLALALALVGGLAGGFMRGLKGEPTTVANPREIIRDDMVYGLLVGPLAGLTAGLLVGLTAGLLIGRTAGLPAGLTAGLLAGFTAACMVGLVVGLASGFAGAARRYGVFLLCSRGKLPFRLGIFLDWTVTAGLLRYSGPGYQFRHRELQQWLADHPHP
ncbi:NACHT domain-containing protein [Streptomyces sp. NBC_00654]|uniref:NACHT domain-containing protein n=1 Tax=Streptomyces sp. NBC_00654 TaxID=2975799 RepID=UPI00225A841C|nr:NACHT domain-containing protein [Streptomyces sp. NBC_00654]MCX4967051.1 NACHT domain-containing protein [Streptomyces sp. NBC_00654]